MFNYPNKKNNFSKHISYSNRGSQLEDDINYANNYYLKEDIAIIYKKPVPIQVVEVNYPKRENVTITKAFYKTPSTTDYNGIFNGKYIDFEAKETDSTTSFSLQNIHKHQIKHMDNVYRHKGITFLIVRFRKIDRTFMLPYKHLRFFNNRAIIGGRKSIKLSEFIEFGFEINFHYKIRVDFLKIIIEHEREFINDEI